MPRQPEAEGPPRSAPRATQNPVGLRGHVGAPVAPQPATPGGTRVLGPIRHVLRHSPMFVDACYIARRLLQPFSNDSEESQIPGSLVQLEQKGSGQGHPVARFQGARRLVEFWHAQHMNEAIYVVLI